MSVTVQQELGFQPWHHDSPSDLHLMQDSIYRYWTMVTMTQSMSPRRSPSTDYSSVVLLMQRAQPSARRAHEFLRTMAVVRRTFHREGTDHGLLLSSDAQQSTGRSLTHDIMIFEDQWRSIMFLLGQPKEDLAVSVWRIWRILPRAGKTREVMNHALKERPSLLGGHPFHRLARLVEEYPGEGQVICSLSQLIPTSTKFPVLGLRRV